MDQGKVSISAAAAIASQPKPSRRSAPAGGAQKLRPELWPGHIGPDRTRGLEWSRRSQFGPTLNLFITENTGSIFSI